MTTKNIAALLVDLLESLDVPGNQWPQKVHGFEDAHDVAGWHRHMAALDLVRNVEIELDALDAEHGGTSVFRSSLGAWYAGVGMANTPWSSKHANPRPACEDQDLKMLRALAMVLDQRPRVIVSKDEERALADVIDQARELLEGDETIERHVKHYLQALLDRAAFLLEHIEEFGAETLRSVAFEIAGAMQVRAEAEDDPEKQSRWRAAAWGMVGGFMTTTGGEGAKAIGRVTIEGIKQLGG